MRIAKSWRTRLRWAHERTEADRYGDRSRLRKRAGLQTFSIVRRECGRWGTDKRMRNEAAIRMSDNGTTIRTREAQD
ncbi:hypothetical protein GCM10027018_24530 [Paenibacillus thermoaerophilus]